MPHKRSGRPNRHDKTPFAMDREIRRRQQTPRGLLAGDRGEVVLVMSTLSHLTYRHPRAYGKHEMVPPPPAANSF